MVFCKKIKRKYLIFTTEFVMMPTLCLNLPLKKTLRSSAALVLALTLSTLSMAQEAPKSDVLKGKNLTENSLIEALTPAPQGIVTRGLKVSRDGTSVAQHTRKPSASLLITFETNSAELTEPAKQQLNVVAAALKNERLSEYSFNVEGHADPRGSSEGNLTLSQQRAESVRLFLISKHQIADSRLKAMGKGDLEPLNISMIAAPENRRVTIITNVAQK
jgi:OmpA-OmpF porin, OOP family